jgi:hypothetical protein
MNQQLKGNVMQETALDPRRWQALALLCGAFFMVILDTAIVIVALPSIQADLGFSEQGLQWVISAYALTFAGLLLLGGRAADLLGRRRVFIAGLLLFTAASLLCGLAWSSGTLLAARARGKQGVRRVVVVDQSAAVRRTPGSRLVASRDRGCPRGSRADRLVPDLGRRGSGGSGGSHARFARRGASSCGPSLRGPTRSRDR